MQTRPPTEISAPERWIDTKYFERHLHILPSHYSQGDTNRMTLGYFCVAGLDLLGTLDSKVSQQQRSAWIEWIYAQQIHPCDKYRADSGVCGFRGSPFAGAPFDPLTSTSTHAGDTCHITMTYTALALLLTLGDDLSRVNSNAIIESLKCLQCDDGSYILSDWRGMNKSKALEYIKASRAFDYGYGQGPGKESHGGSTYCAIASLWLMDELHRGIVSKEKTIFWLLARQETGFQGRINKTPRHLLRILDWCILGSYKQNVDVVALRQFLTETHSSQGGYGKLPDSYPDILHSYMGFAGLSISGDQDLGKLVCALGISQRAYNFWEGVSSKKLL
ncbi:hypothetical protein BASA62_010476 [Batrachochytrium salamandrivorans]|nr:hypothetical protein BASA62_010476 [Batrachochytrium salamandrivorans]